MYMAKAQGKSCFRVFRSEMHDAAVERLEVEIRLRGVADRGELVVHYQPIYEMVSHRVSAVEALVRWQHPERGLLGPNSFIALAEASGRIDEIGDHVLGEALRQVRRWDVDLGAETPAINVNLSPHQLLDRRLPERVQAHLQQSGVRPDRLILEITETVLVEEIESTSDNLAPLRELGVLIAIDDFGTGYCSLSYLQQFPVDIVKIDRQFIDELDEQATEMPLAKMILQLTAGLEVMSIAEGIERPAQLRAAAAEGTDMTP